MLDSFHIAWLAQGQLRMKAPGEPPRTIESQFAKGIRERAVRAQQRHGWKMGGQGERFLAGAMLWGRVPRDPAAIRANITSLCRGAAAGQVLYSLESDDFCAILALEKLGQEERRLWNKNDKRLSHLAMGPDGAMACSVIHKFGTANLAVRLDEDSGLSEITEGDSVDTAPCWVPDHPRRLVFQSAGIGRNRHGHFAGLGPFSIQQLDIDSGKMETLIEDPGWDFLTPQVDEAGRLYYIRRPYQTGRELSPWRMVKDFFLFPFRLLYAIFQFLQFFSMSYTGKKLTSADGTSARPMDIKEMIIWGNRVSANQASVETDETPDLVPGTWQLMRQRPGYDPEVLAKGVLAYDLAPDGSIFYSNGSAIFLRDPGGKTERLHKDRLIEQVIVLRS